MRVAIIASLLLLAGCELAAVEDRPEVEAVAVPQGFDPLPIPVSNQLSVAKVQLGERLFHDPILSSDASISCASCHHADRAFADPRRVSVGVGGRTGIRNSPSLVNVAYQRELFWDGGSFTLEDQVLAPLTDEREMNADLGEVLRRLTADSSYANAFRAVFDRGPDIPSLTQAIAAYERTIVSGGSRYDRWQSGATTLSASEELGRKLFFGKAGCASCHAGFLFTSGEYLNNGLLHAAADSGRARITLESVDAGRFKVPSLRNVGLTAPYMHDGRFSSLDEVVRHYDAGGEGAPNQDPRIQALHLSGAERQAIVDFLSTLTDEVVHDGM